MPDLSYLKVKPGGVIKSSWANELVDWISASLNYGAVDYEGYVRRDLIPVQDLALNLGEHNSKFKEINVGDVYANYGYFNGNVYVQGKRVLKDEDPIYIASFFSYAVNQITDAILNAGLPPKPVRLAITIDYYAPPFSDVFASDIEVQLSGKLIAQIISDTNAIAQVKLTPSGSAQTIIANLNDGNPLPSGAIKEFEITVIKGDKANIRFSNWARVTVSLYNIEK